MKIAFVTTQSLLQPTLIGRIIPIANELSKKGNEVTVLIHEEQNSSPPSSPKKGEGLRIVSTGKNPFTRTDTGKKRQRGIRLAWTLCKNAVHAARALIQLRPEVIVIVKPLPENVFAVCLARIFLRKTKLVLDVDDFELFANVVSSLLERIMLHWSERMACRISSHIIVATPFLGDHMQAISSHTNITSLIPTGYSSSAPLMPNNLAHTILYIGSISKSSGHRVDMLPELLRDVRKEVHNAKLYIAGAGDDELMIKNRIAELGLTSAVTWFGRFTDSDISEIISQSTIIIDPIDDSIVNRAKSSFRTMLACAAGMPIITSNIGIRPFIIPKELHERFFAQTGDEQSYARICIEVLKNQLDNKETALLQHEANSYSTEATATMYYNCLV
ncbi:MAG TPA: glycosyltransferase [Candidatus Andersenbacteria bacterium]|nr:glycosyltransferase [Candidatus Andersenbacteria bacterium]